MSAVLERAQADTGFHRSVEAALRANDIRHADLHDRFYVPEFSRIDDLTDDEVANRLAEIGVLL